MKKIYLSSPILCLLPALAIIPVLTNLILNIHLGGVYLLLDFLKSAITPSTDKLVILSAIKGLGITATIAISSWAISSFTGIIIGIISSNKFWIFLKGPSWLGKSIRRLLAFPRSIHELIWGLLLQSTLGLSPLVAIIAIVIPYSALVARVVADQIDTIDDRSLIALIQAGTKPINALITSIGPAILPTIISYIGYRLECSLRAATILGIFGMGGIGSELELSLRSLEFNEMWTSLWLLIFSIFAIEELLDRFRLWLFTKSSSGRRIIISLILVIIITIMSIILLYIQNQGLFLDIRWNTVKLTDIQKLLIAFNELDWLNLYADTLIMTLLAAGIAIGIPPLTLLILPAEIGGKFLTIIWTFFRAMPIPLTALILLLFTTPSIYVATLALAVQNIGVLGRLLKEGIEQQKNELFHSVTSTGAKMRSAWLYSRLYSESKSYLGFAAYRTDVLLRETAVVGVVGGAGLGWQLQESLSSFDWAQVILIISGYSTLTLIGEAISEYSNNNWINSSNSTPSHHSLQY